MERSRSSVGFFSTLTSVITARADRCLVAGEPTEHRLLDLGEQPEAPVLPGAVVAKEIGGQPGQAEGVIEFPEREQAGAGGDGGTTEFESHSAVERDPQPRPLRLPAASSIRRPLHDRQALALIADSRADVIARRGHLGSAGAPLLHARELEEGGRVPGWR